jgi:hypothetical protein
MQMLSLLLYIIGIVTFAYLTSHYVKLRDGMAKYGLVMIALAICLGQFGNLLAMLSRYLFPQCLSTIRDILIVPEIITCMAGVWLTTFALFQKRNLTKQS